MSCDGARQSHLGDARALKLVVLLAGLALLAGCGGDDEPLSVYAASSLTEVFEQLAPDVRFNFAGSDELATQLRQGAPADVFAAASPRYPGELFDEGLVESPVVFASNPLVIVVPSENPRWSPLAVRPRSGRRAARGRWRGCADRRLHARVARARGAARRPRTRRQRRGGREGHAREGRARRGRCRVRLRDRRAGGR